MGVKVKITSRIGKRGKVNLYLNDEYLMSVPEDFWYSSPVRLTEEVDEAEFTEFLKTANAKSAYQKALELLSRRDYSSRMLANKLAEKFDSEAVAFAVDTTQLGLQVQTPDRRFVAFYVALQD